MKHFKNLILILSAIAATATPFHSVSTVKAAPEVYSYTYNLTNLYSNYPLIYLFTGLATGTTYTWNIQRVGLDGSPQDIIGSITRTPETADAGATGWTWSTFPNVDTPFRVTDNFGNVLGRHFLARDISSSAYWNTAGENALLDRTEIRKPGAVFSATLTTNNGKAIDGLACCYDTMGEQPISEYSSPTGNYLMIHYNIDPAVTESSLEVRSLTDATLALKTNMLEVVDYNLGTGYAFSTGLEYKDFIILATNGSCPFCDPTVAVAKFPTSSIPMYTTLGNDFYECARINDESTTPVIHPCEYMMGVNPSSTPMGMSIPRSLSDVKVNKPVRITFGLSDSTVWNALGTQNFFQTLGVSTDGIAALISALSATPFTSQNIAITPLSAFTGVQSYWTMCAASQYYQSDWSLCLSRMVTYNVTATTTVDFSGSIDAGLQEMDFDNEFSHIFVALLLYVLSFGFISFIGRRTGNGAPKQLYDLAFIGISILLVILGWFGLWTTVILLILCVLALMHAFKGSGASNDA